MFLCGQNSRLFQWASTWSQTLRLSLIMREVLRIRGETLRVCVGRPIRHLSAMRCRAEITGRLRQKTLRLRDASDPWIVSDGVPGVRRSHP